MFQTFQLVPVREKALDEKDEWTGLSDAKERRKRQNRLNQRAARRRQRKNDGRQEEPADDEAARGDKDNARDRETTLVKSHDGYTHSYTKATSPTTSATSTQDLQLSSPSSASGYTSRCTSTYAFRPRYAPGYAALSATPRTTHIDSSLPSISRVEEATLRFLYFPLTPDTRLLHVVTLNIFRGILTNCVILSSVPIPPEDTNKARSIFKLPTMKEMEGYLGSDVNAAAADLGLPLCLLPTEIQQSVPHYSWINVLPSPRLRDNLILALDGAQMDEDDFMMDLLGSDLHDFCSAVTRAATGGAPYVDTHGDSPSDSSASSSPATHSSGKRPKSLAGQPGLVSWDDPWDVSGWEFTEKFTRKWGFLFKGCADVVYAANTWRDRRGEDPLVVEV